MGKRSNGKGRTPREAAKLEARRAEVFRLWRGGMTMRAIGAVMQPKMSAALVSIDCQFALKSWREEHRGSIKETAELEWELLNWIQLEAQLNYELSKHPKERDKLGDPRYLELAMKTGEQRRKLFGIDKPTKIEAQTTTEVTQSSSFKTIAELKADVQKRQYEMQARLLEMSEDK